MINPKPANWRDRPEGYVLGIAGQGGFCFNDGNEQDPAGVVGRLAAENRL
jgi:hypothetical protein